MLIWRSKLCCRISYDKYPLTYCVLVLFIKHLPVCRPVGKSVRFSLSVVMMQLVFVVLLPLPCLHLEYLHIVCH